MKKAGFPFVLLLAISMQPHFAETNWYVYESTSFKAAFPEKPIEETKSLKTNSGEVEVKTLTYNASSTKEKNIKFYISCNEIPNVSKEGLTDTQKKSFFDASIKGAVKNHNGVLLSEKPIKFNEHDGRELKLSMNEGKIVVTMKTYIVANKYYGLAVYSPKQNDLNEEIDFFFNSFALK